MVWKFSIETLRSKKFGILVAFFFSRREPPGEPSIAKFAADKAENEPFGCGVPRAYRPLQDAVKALTGSDGEGKAN